MKILALMDADWFWKGPHQYHHILELLSLKGHEIIVTDYANYWHLVKGGIFSGGKKFLNISRFYDEADITVSRPSFIRIPILDYLSYFFSSRKEIKKLVEEFNPNIIIGFTGILSPYWGMKFAKKNDIPFIYYWLDVVHELIPSKIFRPLALIIERKTIKNSTMLIAINEVLRDYMINLGGESSHAYVIPGGVDFERFDPDTIDPDLIKESYGFSKDDLVLFFMGWIYEFSGLKEVILDISNTKNSCPNLKLMVVGEGDYYPYLKQLIKDKNLEDRVILTGKMPYEEIPQLIGAADICILPAYNNKIMRDIVPIKMYEYLAMHKPVISTELPGVMKEFGHDNGVLYVKSPEDIIKTVIKLNKKDIEENKIKAEKFIKEYNWSRIILDFEQILDSLQEV